MVLLIRGKRLSSAQQNIVPPIRKPTQDTGPSTPQKAENRSKRNYDLQPRERRPEILYTRQNEKTEKNLTDKGAR